MRKKFLLMTFLTLLFTAMGTSVLRAQESYVAKVGDNYYTTLVDAIAASTPNGWGDEVTLLQDITLVGDYTDPSEGLRIEQSVTINGAGHTIDCGTFNKGIRIYENDDQASNVMFKNITIVNNNAQGRCIDTRSGSINLFMQNTNLTADGVNSQPLTIGGSETMTKVTISGGTIDAGTSGYGVICFVPVTNHINVQGSAVIKGFAAFYLKEGVNNTSIKLAQSTSIGKNEHASASGVFGAVVIEGSNNTVRLEHDQAVVKAVAGDGAEMAPQAAFLFRGNNNTVGYYNNATPQVITEGGQSYFVMANADNAATTKFVDNGIERKLVAENEGYQFYSFEEAVRFAGNEGTIKVVNDFELAETWIVDAGQNITLDLNGKTISAGWEDQSAGKHIYAIDNKGTLKITGNGTINARGIFNYGAMTLENGTINAIDGNGGYAVRNYAGSLTMNGGTIATTLEDDHQVDEGGYDATPVRVDEGATFTMNGGVINNICDFTVAIDNHGTTIITDGKATTVHTTLANHGTMTINGGEFTCNGLEGITAHALWATAGSTTTINGGTFNGKDNYNGFNVDASAGAIVNITGGNFLPVHSGSLYGDGTITVSGGTFFDEVPEERCAEGYIPQDNGNGTYGVVHAPAYGKVAKIGDVYYETLAEAVAAAQSGATITLLNGEHELPLFAGKELTFKGESKDGVIVNDAPAATTQGWNGSTFHFENLTAKGATANYHGLANGVVAVTYKECDINGLRFLYSPTTFENCAFNANGVEHSFWTYGASNVTVKNSTFTYTDRAVNCYSENGANHELDITFEECDFEYVGPSDEPAGAVEINSGSVKSIDLEMNDCTAPAKGAMWFNSQWDPKHGANTVVEVDGVVVWTAPAKIGETKYATLQEAVDAAQDGDVVTLIADVTENEVLITQKADVDVTIDGSGKEFTGHMTIFGSGRHTGAETLTIRNVVFKAVNDKGECIASATNINGVNSYAHNVTIDGCSFNGNDTYSADNTFAIRFPSGGVGYNLTVTGCTADDKMFGLLWVTQVVGDLIVNDCTAEGVKEGIVLTSTAKATITNTTIDASNVAIRAGQAGAADGTINEFTFNNNTLKSDAIAIQIRGNATDANLSMTENVVSGTPHISGNTADTNISADANYWGEGLTGPVVDGTNVDVNSYYADEAREQLIVTALTLQQFVEKVTEGNGTYNGTFTEGDVEKNITVKVVPVSGDARTTDDVRVPNRLQKYTNPEVYYAQYQRFSELTDVNISNVNFVFYPAAVTVTDAWNTAGATTTADNINGELQLLNTGSVSFANCSFEKMSVSPINAATLIVTSSTFNGLDAYAIKDVKATTATITGTTFTYCNGGFWFNNAPTKLTVTDNTFTGTGRRGAIQFSANGDYANTEMTVTDNEVADNAAFLWQLNNTISNAQLNAILDKNNNTYETAFVAGSVELHLQGEGTEENPYLINDISDLEFFRDDVNEDNTYAGKYIKLTADIDLNNEEWTPIGNNTNKFQGYFDGNEKTISKLKISGNNDYVGLFGYILGQGMSASITPSVKDLTLENVDVSGDYYVGGLSGQAYTCNITNVTVKGEVSGARYVGGIVGHVYTYFKDCHFIGNASCSFDALGGIAGAGDCRAYDCSVIGDITGSNWVGGIVGNGQEGTSAVGCYVKGDVKTSTNWYFGVGGIAGVAGHGYSSSEFKNNYFDGEVYLEGEKVPAMIIGIVNAENNETIYATIEGNSWNTAYYDVNIPVYVTAEAPQNGTTENWIAGASEELTKPRNNNLIMLESDLQYVTEEDYVIMSFSEVTEEQVEQALINNAVAKIGETTYTTLQKALDAAVAGTGNVTVEIIKDINLTNVDWNPVTVSAPNYPVVTVNGNNKTITGLNDMLFAGTWAGGSGLIINNLTIANSNIVNDKDDTQGTVGVGAFIGYPQASATITLNNCHLKDSHVEGGHWTGGLIGMAGGYNGNDGPVFMNLTIKDCSVKGSTITGKGSCGGIIGHGSCAAWTAVNIQNTTVSDNYVISIGSSTNKAGAIMGTIGAAGQPTTANGVTMTGGAMVAATVSGNTVTSGGTAITTIYGRQGTNTGILELNGGSYDNYPIEQNVAYAKPAAGLMIEQNEYGTYGLVPDPAYGKVAMIGETYYETLQEAVNVGGEVKVIANITLDQTVIVLADKTVVLDLNGKIISTSAEETSYAINNLGTLTLKDSSEGKTGAVNARGIYNGYDENGNHVASAKIIVESGTYNAKGTNGGAAIFNYGIAEINGGTFTSIGGYSLSNQSGSSITVADGVTANNGIYISNGVLTINGGDIDGNRSGCHVVYALNSTVTINGGDFYNNNSGNATIMAAGTTQMTIKGGIFGIKDGRVPGNANTWTSCLTDTQNSATMIVIGGTFNGGFRVQNGTTMTIEGGSFNDCFGSGYNIYGTATVKGGTFTDNAAITFARNYLADGFKLEENADGTYGVVPFEEKSYEIKENTTLADAIAQAKEDGAEIVTYIIYGAATLETGFSHGIVDFGGEEGYITIQGANVNTRSEDSFTITGGGVPDIKGVTFKDLTFYDEGTYLPTANEFMYQNFIDCTFENVKFEDGIRLSGNCTIKDCEVNANTTDEYAIWLDEGEFEITGTEVEAGNDAYGMIKSDNAEKITITDNTFTYLGKVNKEALNTKGATIIADGNTFIDCAKGIVPADKVNYTADGTTQITDAIIALDNTIIIYVAKIGDVKYQSLAEAATAAANNATIQLLWAEGHAPIAMNASLYGNKTVTITGTATVDWSKGWLFVGRGGEGDATLIFDGAILTSNEESLANGSYGIHVSAKEGDEVNKNYGKVIFKNSDVQLSFLANRNNVEVDGGKLYVHYGFWVGGRPSIETPDGLDGTATMDIKNGAVVVVNNHNGMGLGHESNGIMNIDATSTFETTQSFTVTAKGTMNNAGTVNITGTLTNNGIINFTGLDAKLTAQGGLTIVDKVNNSDYAIAYLDGTYQYAKYVAQIGEAKYLTLQEAINAAQNDETITLLVDVDVTTPAYGQNALNHARAINFTLDLNGKTLSANTGNSVFRFNIANSGATGDVTVTIKNGTVVSGEDTWCTLMSSGISDDVRAVMNLEDLVIENYKGGDFAVKAWANGVVNAEGVTINSTYGGGFYALGGEITLNDCTVNQEGLWTAPYNSMAVAVSNGGKMTVNSGTYSAAPLAATDGNNQGSSHGSWVVGVLNSGGTLIINGGTFSNDNYGDNLLATAARGAVLADTGAEIEINGGTFNALKAIIDIQNNLGDQNNNPSALLSGGTFSADPRTSASYGSNLIVVAAGYSVVENEDDTYSVVEDQVAKIGDVTYKLLQEAVDAVAEGETIVLIDNIEQADGVIITDKKNIIIDLNEKTFTVTEGASTNNRNFKIKGTSVVTIKNGTMVAAGDYSSGAYGTVRTEGTAKVTLTGLKLYNYRGNGLNIKALGGTTVEIDSTEIYSEYGGGIEAAGGTITLAETVKVEQKGMYTAPYNSMAISVNGGGTVIVEGGTYSTECITAEEANGQGTSHGPWVVGVLNSGGTLIINGGTFSNDNYGDNNLATYARGAVLADTGAEIEIKGGTFNALKAIIDIQNNLNGANPVVTLKGGTYSADPRTSANYGSNLIVVAENYDVKELPNGYYTVIQTKGTQTREFAYPGWYWFSTYIDFESGEEGLDELQEQLGGNAATIKGQTAFTNYQYYNGVPFWTSALTSISASEMYMIKTTNEFDTVAQTYENVSVSLEGNFVDYESYEITIHNGWNWIGYPLNTEVSVTEALAGFTPAIGDQIKGKTQGSSSSYYPTLGGWYPDFNMIPGEGYMYYSAASVNKTLTYRAGNGGTQNAKTSVEDNHWIVDEYKYSNNMTVIAMLSIDGEIVKGNYEVAAFANGECRGSARPIYIESIDAYVLFMTIHGDEVEELTFMYYDIDKDTEYELNNVMNYSNDAIVGTIDNPYIFSMNILGIGENSIDNINIYPNPTTTDREINLQAICDKVEVFNALGVKVAEYHNVDTLDALETAGIYVIRITNDNAVKHCRLVVK